MIGAGLKPQLPPTSVVMPWRRNGSISAPWSAPGTSQSECEWMSMKPGVTVLPRAIDGAGGREPGEVADGGDAVAADRHVGAPRRARRCRR